ncbi:MAG TPA: NAD+ synthase [Steroidobacteraceae bacterium]
MTGPGQLRCVMAQLNLVVGDVDGNTSRIVAAAHEARDRHHADVVLLPELAVSGYPPEDLLFHSGMRTQVTNSIERLRREVRGITLIAGYPEYDGTRIFNAAIVIRDGVVLANHRKACLPNYRVFDEKRYFTPGTEPTVLELNGVKAGVLVCEDVWDSQPAAQARAAGAQVLLVINASPYEVGKQAQREQQIGRSRVAETGIPLVFLNLLGGQDELVFDGNSFVMDARGEVTLRAPAFTEGMYVVDLAVDAAGVVRPVPGDIVPLQGQEESVYGALVQGTRDYVDKHRFPGVVLGLSGGVDSALTLCIAVDALGADRVRSVAMPSRYTSQMSKDDAAEQAGKLHVKHSEISIEGMFEATLAALQEQFVGRAPDTAEENIQSRCRGVLLMGISNKTGRMLLTTGNKSEMAVGYATLYGDMAGGFAPIKDCSKLLVYRLCAWRNAQSPVIPPRVIEREPSAELRHGQKDTDSLPPYEILDPILEAFIEEDLSVDQIAARGFDRKTVGRILDLVKRNEYKRRQAPPGVRVSGRAFGRDWRYPITSGYKSH